MFLKYKSRFVRYRMADLERWIERKTIEHTGQAN